MKKLTPIILIAIATILFEYNYEITNYFKPQQPSPEWWDFRFKIYSGMFLTLALIIFIVTKKLTRITTIPLLGFTIDDFIDRVIFNSPKWHWSDWIIVIMTIIVMVVFLINYVRSKNGINKGFT